jgi:hypothetical protein
MGKEIKRGNGTAAIACVSLKRGLNSKTQAACESLTNKSVLDRIPDPTASAAIAQTSTRIDPDSGQRVKMLFCALVALR